MPFIEVNNCRLFYELFGNDRADQPPVILIHGSTQTGRSCWELAAALLGRSHRVIVPDCRGHGQSSNPNNSYSFQEMADDIAGLIQALGYRRAHIIGHSNGGNVALVTLVSHPEVVQSAVLQAANAFVSPDLVEIEPGKFDPVRVAREVPTWRDEMIALHGPTHGENYWKDLLHLTVAEIVREPNYSKVDLAAVNRATLVIQGEDDRVNATAGHGQFIAAHIPYAEKWLPAQTGHNVHVENLCAWIDKVEDFFSRRGDDWNNALYCLKRRAYSDDRINIFRPKAGRVVEDGEAASIALTGVVLTDTAHQEAVQLIREMTDLPLQDEIHSLLGDAPWGLVSRPVNDLRQAPSIRSERVSQALLGEAVRVLQPGEDWSLVRLEKDGYLGWLPNAAIHLVEEEEVHAYQSTFNARVRAELLTARLVGSSNENIGDRSGKIPFGVRLVQISERDDTVDIRLPDGAAWRLAKAGIIDRSQFPEPNRDGIQFTLRLINRFIGIPYLWGGRTPFGYDCSGLAQTFWDFLGVAIPRDADQQFQVGTPVVGAPNPGDLLFFGEQDPWSGDRFGHISHVAIAINELEFIHSNGTAWGVSINCLDPASRRYRPWLAENLIGVRRFA